MVQKVKTVRSPVETLEVRFKRAWVSGLFAFLCSGILSFGAEKKDDLEDRQTMSPRDIQVIHLPKSSAGRSAADEEYLRVLDESLSRDLNRDSQEKNKKAQTADSTVLGLRSCRKSNPFSDLQNQVGKIETLLQGQEDPYYPHAVRAYPILDEASIFSIRPLPARLPADRPNRCGSVPDTISEWNRSNDQPIGVNDSDWYFRSRKCEFASRRAASAEFLMALKNGTQKKCPEGCEPGLWMDYESLGLTSNSKTGEQAFQCTYRSTVGCIQIDEAFRACGSRAEGGWITNQLLVGEVKSQDPNRLFGMAQWQCQNRFGQLVQEAPHPQQAYAQLVGNSQGFAPCDGFKCQTRIRVPDHLMGSRTNNDFQPYYRCVVGRVENLGCRGKVCDYQMNYQVELFKLEECHASSTYLRSLRSR